MVQRTAGGIRYDTKVRSGGGSSSSSSGSSGSGSEKLAAFKEMAAARASPGETPEQYRKRVTSPPQPRPVSTPTPTSTPIRMFLRWLGLEYNPHNNSRV